MAYGLTQSLDLATADNASVADHTDFDLGDTFTIEGWFNADSLPGDGARANLFGKWLTTGDQRSYGGGIINVGGTYYFQLYTDSDGVAGGASTSASDAISISTGNWYHAAFILDGGTSQFYCEAVDCGGGDAMSTPFNGTGAFVLGAERTDGTDGFDGKQSLWRVWKGEARSQANLAANKCNVLGSTTNLSAEWTLDNTYNDNSGNSHTLTANGSPSFIASVPSTCTASTFTPTVMIF